MPFSTSSVSKQGLGNGRYLTTGDWSGAVGDATGTVTLTGANVYGFQFWSNVAGGYVQAAASYTVSGNLITFTVENVSAITDGTFFVIHG